MACNGFMPFASDLSQQACHALFGENSTVLDYFDDRSVDFYTSTAVIYTAVPFSFAQNKKALRDLAQGLLVLLSEFWCRLPESNGSPDDYKLANKTVCL